MPKLCLNMIVKNEGSVAHPVLKYLTPFHCRLKEPGPYPSDKVRVGGNADGGYIMLNDFEKVTGVFSYGVGSVEIAGEDCMSFDYDLACRGLPVILFDHTIDKLPQWHPNFVFNKQGVGPKDMKKTATIKTQLKALPYSPDLVLKMDVEGAEYDAINATPPATLRKFRQIIIELHDLTLLNEPKHRAKVLRTLQKLSEDHWLFHVHGNNTAKWGEVDGFKVLDVLELSYVRKDLVEAYKNEDKFPTAWDRPCWPKFADVTLDFYPFAYQKPKILRCLESVAPWIDSWVIYDTGSTDDTRVLVEGFFARRDIPGDFVRGQFINFEQARNAALTAARTLNDDWDYLLLADADMELVVEDETWRDQLGSGGSYSITQRNGGISYSNPRLVNKTANGLYIGVTHEYLNIPDAGLIKGVWYRDHCDGANRPNKFKRDIQLLETALKSDPNNGRYLYYLASTYADAGNPEKAEPIYLKRINLGGWPEETWSAMYKRAHCFRAMGKESEFIRECLSSYNFRPERVEPLYDLAKFYRERGMNFAALTIAEEGLRIPYPSDVLFVQDYPYETGMQEEFAIVAFYDQRRRQRGFEAANKLSLSQKGTWHSREQARMNLYHYIKPLSEQIPSFKAKQINFRSSRGWNCMNPCITEFGGRMFCLVRTVNYTMDEAGRYLIKGTNGEAHNSNPINTENFLLSLDDACHPQGWGVVQPPEGFPSPVYPLVIGQEDMRIFRWGDKLMSISNIREQNPEGWCEQYMARLHPSGQMLPGQFLRPEKRQHEKNWMPFVLNSGDLRFVYRPGVYLNPENMQFTQNPTGMADDHISGGSQMIPFMGGYLGVVHEARHLDNGKRWYQHRFMFLNDRHVTYSLPFVFHDRVIEFAAGICAHPDGKHIVVSYGREDKEAWVCVLDKHELAEFVHA